MIKKLFFLLLTGALLGAAPIWAADGDWDRAKAAHERGDYTAEIAIIRPLAEKGFAFAQFNLGVLYDQGNGVPQDNALAMQWYQKAAEQGLSQAQVNLAIMYREGQGMPVNLTRAYFWFELADAQGDSQAPEAKRELAEKLTPAQVTEAERQATEFMFTHSFTVPPLPPYNPGSAHGGG
ncbi:tetratricopeptide repeat protein [Candidatus Contendibacter odensensis]|nr:tetratricopeptide repeat protein [Candidatus Contendobacter odensis]